MKAFDQKLFFAVLGLTVFGLIMMSSISIASSFEVTGKNDFYFWRHFWHIIVSIPIFIVMLRFPLEQLRRASFLIYLIGVVLLILTLTIGESFGTAAKSWLDIGVMTIQPVEAMKIALVIFLSAIFASNRQDPDTLEGGFIPFVAILFVPAVLIVAQPDFGSLMLVVFTAASIYFVAGANLKHFLGGMIFSVLGAIILSVTTPYIRNRVMVFLNPELDPLRTGFQVKQALIAIGSGGIFGRGFQNSIQKFDYLPEVQSDTIFSAIAEEMGFIRIMILIGIYLFIAWRGLYIAQHAPDKFTQCLATGLTVLIAGQAFINIAVNMALLPNTGITLPLVSSGGSSLIMTLAACGLLLNISSELKTHSRRRPYTLSV